MRNRSAQIPQTQIAFLHSSQSILQTTRSPSVGVGGWLFWALAFEESYKAGGTGSELPSSSLGTCGAPGCYPNPSGDKIGPLPQTFAQRTWTCCAIFDKASPYSVGFWVICPVTRALTLPSVEVTGGVRTDSRGFSAREASSQTAALPVCTSLSQDQVGRGGEHSALPGF